MLTETIVSRVIKELNDNPALAEWVHAGLAFHDHEGSDVNCRFCGQPVPPKRLEELESHFNDEYDRFIGKIDAAIERIRRERESLSATPPESSRLYEHLISDYEKAGKELSAYAEKAASLLGEAERALVDKRGRAFDKLAFEPATDIPDAKLAADAIARVNGAIKSHNEQTAHFESMVQTARKRLEDSLVAQALEEFRNKEKAVEQREEEVNRLKVMAQATKAEINKLEIEIVQHRQPAEELNRELASYLGSDHLRLEVNETGYSLTRSGAPATNLSEGEKTAIAFLYFLKSLQDKSFDLAKGIVVIDDPVSSLDSNALFSAFGFMRERTKNAGQLFIFTHNFAFFRQVKNWFNRLPGQGKSDPAQRPARFYMLDAGNDGGVRTSVLKALDPLLHEYESEYHYLFKKVYEAAQSTGAGASLAAYYGLPNMARRLLESFLAFRYPSSSGNLHKQMEDQVHSIDPAKKARLIRFTHTHSHDEHVPEPEHDLSILSETPQILRDLLDLMKGEDKGHFEEMLKIVGHIGEVEDTVVAATPAPAEATERVAVAPEVKRGS